MSSVQVHLALTHVPVILSLVGLAILATGIIIKNATLLRTSYILLLTAGIMAIPVFLTGEGAEETVEGLPGVSEAIIERHEEMAKLAMISISVAGLFSLVALLATRWPATTRLLRILVLILAITAGGLMVQTAHLGGQIRHTEIRSGATPGTNNGNGIENANEDNRRNYEEKD